MHSIDTFRCIACQPVGSTSRRQSLRSARRGSQHRRTQPQRPKSSSATQGAASMCREDAENDKGTAHGEASNADQAQPLSHFSRRHLILGSVTTTLAAGAPSLQTGKPTYPVAEAIPITSRLPPIGQAAPGTYNLGVAAVRDPALYRLTCI